MAYQVLHSQFVDALLNGESVSDVKSDLDAYCDRWKRRLERQYAVATAMEEVLHKGQEDNPERGATIQYLKALKEAGEQDDTHEKEN